MTRLSAGDSFCVLNAANGSVLIALVNTCVQVAATMSERPKNPGAMEGSGAIVGTPSAESDAAIARAFLDHLEAKHDGTTWRVRERPQTGVAIEPTSAEVQGSVTGAVDDEGESLRDAA